MKPPPKSVDIKPDHKSAPRCPDDLGLTNLIRELVACPAGGVVARAVSGAITCLRIPGRL
jgi:hypothetical protein